MPSGKVVVTCREGASYPAFPFDPSERYPEYLFGEDAIAAGENYPYDAVRNSFRALGLDGEHFGTAEWNPLGDYVAPGATILVKPNLVMHANGNERAGGGLDCLVTHPSIIRAVCDYCQIALGGKGRIIIGDAPMQGCDFESLCGSLRLKELIGLYQIRGAVRPELRDFRQFEAVMGRSSVIEGKRFTDSVGVTVHLGRGSKHFGSGSNGRYQVSDYDIGRTMARHHGDVHDYVVVEEVLEADLVINLCKPKTHRLAGFTAAMKNMVGITYDKSCLPHRSAGSIPEGGDAYEHPSALKRAADGCLTLKQRCEEHGAVLPARLLRYSYGAFLLASRKIAGDPYFIGGWRGNDTIWRTVRDLNRIVAYADSSGVLRGERQRRLLAVGDMVIAGEGEGPVSPSPKPLGVVLASESFEAFDMAVCKVMGFPYEEIPLTRSLMEEGVSPEDIETVCFGKSGLEFEGSLEDMPVSPDWRFLPHSGWRNLSGHGGGGHDGE